MLVQYVQTCFSNVELEDFDLNKLDFWLHSSTLNPYKFHQT